MSRSPRSLLLATRSSGKLRELGPMLRDAGFAPVTLDELGIAPLAEEESVEAFETFAENSLAKARYYYKRALALGAAAPSLVLADDSGLEVHALGGAPGVRSKRYSGSTLDGQALDDANNAKLQLALRDVTDRSARYVCVAVIKSESGELHASGSCAGRIVELPRGADGFGYDPYFFSEELGKTFGEASRAEKERVSHRARAVAAVLERLRAGE
ncbi:MAG TPA: non-canonical purine NTP pyrophosphatase [Gemmatimonadaceae bacterium]